RVVAVRPANGRAAPLVPGQPSRSAAMPVGWLSFDVAKRRGRRSPRWWARSCGNKLKVEAVIKSTKYDARVSLVAMALVACSAAGLPGLAHAGPEDLVIVRAKEAQRVNSRPRLEAARDEALAQGHALASWADFWALRAKLPQATVAEVDEFLARWPQAYVADRLRNDWLLELGKRGD